MKSSVQTIKHESATIEVATITHERRDFTNMGSIVDTSQGFIFAYVSSDEARLTTWQGKTIAALTRTGRAQGFHGVKLTCYTCTIDGARYHGRGLGAGMCIRMRASASKRRGD